MYNSLDNKNNKNNLIINIIILLIIIFIFFKNLFFIVEDRQFAIITDKANKAIKFIDKPGLNLKNPFKNTVLFFEKRIISLELRDQTFEIKIGENIKFNAFLKFKITDIELFYNNVVSKDNFLKILEENIKKLIINSNFNDILSENYKLNLDSFGIYVVDFKIKRFSLNKEQEESLKTLVKGNLEQNLNKNIKEKEKILNDLNKDLNDHVKSIVNKAKIDGEKLVIDSYINYFKMVNNIIGNDVEFYDIYHKSQFYKNMQINSIKHKINMKGN